MVGEINTGRLLLRPAKLEDLDLLVELDSDSEVMRFITGQPSAREDVESELAETLGERWLLFDDAGTFVGWVGATSVAADEYEIGWRLRRASWGQGFATEAALALVRALFSTGARRIFAQTMAVNERSRAVMGRVGLRYAQTLHLDFEDPLPGTEFGEVEYELTLESWEVLTSSD